MTKPESVDPAFPCLPFAHSRVSGQRGAVHPLWLILIAALVLAGGGALTYYWPHLQPGGSPGASNPPDKQGRPGGRRQGFDPSRPMPVVAAAAKSGDVNVYLNGLGTVTPVATVTVRTRVDGQLMKVLFGEGQVVRAGDLLAEIDPRSYEAQLGQAEGQLARDQALLANARIDLERYRALFKQDSIAKQQLDTQESLVRQYEGTLKVDRAAIDTAKLMLSYCRITAPVGGRLGLRQVDPGNIVRASDPGGLVVITQLQPITVVFTIPEDNVRSVMSKIRAREKLPVDVWDRADKTKLAAGSLLTADNQVDPATGTVKLKALFGNTDYGLFPNQFVNARLLLEVKRGVTSIPTAAVQRGRQGAFVYVVKQDSSVSVRAVTLGAARGEITAIESGLASGERVVVDGADKLREGAKVDTEAGSGPLAGSRKGGEGKGGRRDGEGKGGGRKGGDGVAPPAKR